MIQESRIADAQQREHPDPHERGRPVPRGLIAMIGLVFSWAVGYIALAHPNDQPELGDSRTKSELVAHAAAGGAANGAQIFAAQCAACHQANGAGLPGVFPPLAGSEWVQANEKLPINILLHGITGKLTVKGTTYNGAMPSFKDKLSDAEIAAVLTHVRSNFGNAAGRIEPTSVQAVRVASKDRTTPWSGDDELAKLKQ